MRDHRSSELILCSCEGKPRKKKTIRLERDSNSRPDSHTGSVLNQLSSQRQTIKISKELVCQEIYQLLPLTENSLSLVIAKK